MSKETVPEMLKAAIAHHKAGRIEDAARLYAQILQLDPNQPSALHMFGQIYLQYSKPEIAETLFTRALAVQPDNADILDSLALAVNKQRRRTEAEAHYRRLLTLDPTRPSAWMNLGLLLTHGDNFEEAESCLRKALEHRPAYPRGLNNLAALLCKKDRYDEAMELLHKAVDLDPDFPDALQNLATVQKQMGFVEAAKETYLTAMAKYPTASHARRGYLSLLCYLPNQDPEEVFTAHRAYASSLPGPKTPPPPFANGLEETRRLRIGYVSSDFRDHPVARNMLPVYTAHDRERFEIFSYADVHTTDRLTETFRGHSDHWRDILGLGDEAIASMVRTDGIDLLVILGGHFDNNRLALPKFKPAPLCLSFHDVATSGLEEMDYLIADPTLAPKSSPERFTERILRLPRYYLHLPLDGTAPPNPPPCLSAGYVTFGAFHNPSKINRDALHLWAEILGAVPGSRLLMKYRDFYRSTIIRENVLSICRAAGVAEDRVIFQASHDPIGEHLKILAQADISLDAFPFSGSTTTFDNLWAGVPVVTLPGSTMVSRWTASTLKAVGLNDLIATSESDYICIAKALAENPKRLSEMRADLRNRLLASSICNPTGRTRQLERLYRAVWRKWVREQRLQM
ncbi:MAG: hypothetical protein A2516_04065 [Alphaproteobacteria bacterium RIFOXYD12_FULL_60_8]|nr:MAG: hypothetical protein A2516_04065 [Alphaproteobacteria bacterium RIFOXYD12_FULL_60_8]